jgi:trans-aconitate methyltransferase
MSDTGGELSSSYYFAHVIDGKLTLGQEAEREVRSRILVRLRQVVERYDAHSVMEIGSGTGRNLIYLKAQLPDLAIVGLELSPASVQTARDAAQRFGMDGTFAVQDMTADWKRAPVDLCFSIHAIEQIPAGAAAVVERMRQHSRRAVVVWEPLPDLLSGMPRRAVEQRIRALDRLRAGAFDELPVTEKTLLPAGSALNRTTEVHFTGAAPAQ